MSLTDDYLKKHDLKYEELTPDEKTTLYALVDTVQAGQLSIEKFKDTISAMKYGVEQALVDEPEYIYIFIFKVLNRKHVFLKARLKNYMLLEAFLHSPERAKQALEKALGAVKK